MNTFNFLSRWIVAGFVAFTLVLGGSALLTAPAFAEPQVFVGQSGNNRVTVAIDNGRIVTQVSNKSTGTTRTTTTFSDGSTKTTTTSGGGSTTTCTDPEGNSMPCP